MLDQDAATAHLLHSVRTAEVQGPKARCREAIAVAAENMSAAGVFDRDAFRDPAATVAVDGVIVREPVPSTEHPVLRRSNCCPKCGGDLTDEPARKAEPDTDTRAFAGGTACDDCGAEFEAEDTHDGYDWHRIRRGEVF